MNRTEARFLRALAFLSWREAEEERLIALVRDVLTKTATEGGGA